MLCSLINCWCAVPYKLICRMECCVSDTHVLARACTRAHTHTHTHKTMCAKLHLIPTATTLNLKINLKLYSVSEITLLSNYFNSFFLQVNLINFGANVHLLAGNLNLNLGTITWKQTCEVLIHLYSEQSQHITFSFEIGTFHWPDRCPILKVW
jgi:hypothetical protein